MNNNEKSKAAGILDSDLLRPGETEPKHSESVESSDMRNRRDIPGPEVVEKAKHRRFTTKYKAKIVKEADACTEPGQIGALLRREGLYSSHLSDRKSVG